MKSSAVQYHWFTQPCLIGYHCLCSDLNHLKYRSIKILRQHKTVILSPNTTCILSLVIKSSRVNNQCGNVGSTSNLKSEMSSWLWDISSGRMDPGMESVGVVVARESECGAEVNIQGGGVAVDCNLTCISCSCDLTWLIYWYVGLPCESNWRYSTMSSMKYIFIVIIRQVSWSVSHSNMHAAKLIWCRSILRNKCKHALQLYIESWDIQISYIAT